MKFSSTTLATAAAIISVVSFPSSAAAASTRGGGADAMESVSEKVVVDVSPAVVDVAPKEENGRRLRAARLAGQVLDFESQSTSSQYTGAIDAPDFMSNNLLYIVQITEYNNEGIKKACSINAQITLPTDVGTVENFNIDYTTSYNIQTTSWDAGRLTTIFNNLRLVFESDDSPSNKAKIVAHLNGEKVNGSEISKIARMFADKAKKLKVIQVAHEVGLFDKCREAADLLALSNTFIGWLEK